MSYFDDRTLSRRALTLLLGSAIASAPLAPPLTLPALAEEPAPDAIERALTRSPRRTRGPADPAKVQAARARIEQFQQIRRTRGLNLQEREELAQITEDKPQIDLTVYFGFDSARIEPQAAISLNRLAQALVRPGLSGKGFGIFGHTDAAGAAQYNQALSERRAEAVRDYLVASFGIKPETLLAVGYGFERLKDPRKPLADENRRVQIVNLDR
jgi:outer membrane protein OmpA-like peptidoglycan-associated protein